MTKVCDDVVVPLDVCDDEVDWRNDLLNQVDGYGGNATGAGIDMMGPSGDLDLCTVTNRDDSGPGSLRWCVSSGRWIDFDPAVFPKNPTEPYLAGGNLALVDPISVPQTIFLESPLIVPANVTIEARGACVRISQLNGGDVVRVTGNNVILYNLELFGHGPRTWSSGSGANGPGAGGPGLGSTLNIQGADVWASHMKLWQGDQHSFRSSSANVTLSHSQIWNIAGSAGYVTGGPFTTHHNWWVESLANMPAIDGAVAHQFSDYVQEPGQSGFERHSGTRVFNGGCLTSESNQFTPRSFCDSLDCLLWNQGGSLVASNNTFTAPQRPDFFSGVNQTGQACGVSGTCPPIPYDYTPDPPCAPPTSFFYNGSPQWPAGWECANTGWIDTPSRADVGVTCP